YYQYSAWFRNICSKCACDSNGKGPASVGYIPTGPGDSSGVHPNLTFNVNGYDYYTTGDMPYTGQWIRKGFTYLTGPTQTSMIIYVRNNAPGGGGNDWALDDISVASCVPNISLTPNKADTLCRGSDDTVRFKVTAFFNNYTQWKLEKSVNGGSTWTDPGIDTLGNASSGTATPGFNPVSGLYEYLVTRYYRLNNIDTTVIYRLTVASTPGNLSNPGCNFITSSPKIVRTANCNVTLPTQVYVKGTLGDGGLARIQWTSRDETSSIQYVVERSDDAGAHYRSVYTASGTASPGMGASYTFNDAVPVAGEVYYRIQLIDHEYHNYSAVILLSNSEIAFKISGLVNPFNQSISFNLTVPEDHDIQVGLYDTYGRLLMSNHQTVYKGINRIVLREPAGLQTGMYILQLIYQGQAVTRQLIKKIN
ncbi:MAG TPA: T9SS type A sorting domain-containing protein, partial [Puia sp.]|nr:T9SS type A sorting domain-containing protein [Puia sp.]